METEKSLSILEDKLTVWWEYAVRMLPNFLLAIIVVAAFIIIGKLIRRFSENFFSRVFRNQSVSGLLSGIIYSLIVVGGIMSALDILELDKTVSGLIAGVGIIGLALGFAFQDLTANFISGAFIALKRPFDVGHIIETNGFLGTVEDIQLRSTTIRTSAGLHVILPNKDIFQKPIINYSRTDARRVELEFVLSNAVDVNFAEHVIHDALNKLSKTMQLNNAEVFFMAIENPNIRVSIYFWTTKTAPLEYLRARHEVIVAIYAAFRDNKIYTVTIPQTPQPILN